LADWAAQFDRELDPAKRATLRTNILAFERDNVISVPVISQDGLWLAGPRLLEYTPRPATHSSGNVYTIKVKP